MYFCNIFPDPGNNGTALRSYVFDDELTTMDDWYDIVEACQQQDQPNIALDILAAATVIMSIRGATHYMEQMERQRAEEEKRRQQEELKLKEAKGKKKKRKKYLHHEDNGQNYDTRDTQDTEVAMEPM